MLLVPNPLKVFAVQGVTDMRKSFSGLVGLVETQLGQQVESGHLFLFFNRRRNSVKVLYFVGDGLVIYYRRLEQGTFELPQRMRASPTTSIEPPTATAKPRRRTPKRFVFPPGFGGDFQERLGRRLKQQAIEQLRILQGQRRDRR